MTRGESQKLVVVSSGMRSCVGLIKSEAYTLNHVSMSTAFAALRASTDKLNLRTRCRLQLLIFRKINGTARDSISGFTLVSEIFVPPWVDLSSRVAHDVSVHTPILQQATVPMSQKSLFTFQKNNTRLASRRSSTAGFPCRACNNNTVANAKFSRCAADHWIKPTIGIVSFLTCCTCPYREHLSLFEQERVRHCVCPPVDCSKIERLRDLSATIVKFNATFPTTRHIEFSTCVCEARRLDVSCW